jgi:hypothetical protein
MSPKKHLDDNIMYHLTRCLGSLNNAQEFWNMFQTSPQKCVLTGGFLLGVLNGHEFGDIDIAAATPSREACALSNSLERSSMTQVWHVTQVFGTHVKCKWTSLVWYMKGSSNFQPGFIDTYQINDKTYVQVIGLNDAAQWIKTFDFPFLRNSYSNDGKAVIALNKALKKECVVDFYATYVESVQDWYVGSPHVMTGHYNRLLKYRNRGYDIILTNIVLDLPDKFRGFITRDGKTAAECWYEFWSTRV